MVSSYNVTRRYQSLHKALGFAVCVSQYTTSSLEPLNIGVSAELDKICSLLSLSIFVMVTQANSFYNSKVTEKNGTIKVLNIQQMPVCSGGSTLPDTHSFANSDNMQKCFTGPATDGKFQ